MQVVNYPVYMYTWFDNNLCLICRVPVWRHYSERSQMQPKLLIPSHTPARMPNTLKQRSINWGSWRRSSNLPYCQVKGLLFDHCRYWSEQGRSGGSTGTWQWECQVIHHWNHTHTPSLDEKKQISGTETELGERHNVFARYRCSYFWSIQFVTIPVLCIDNECNIYLTGIRITETSAHYSPSKLVTKQKHKKQRST